MGKRSRQERIVDPFENMPDRLRHPRIVDWVTGPAECRTGTDRALWEGFPAWRDAVIEHTGCTPEEFSAWVRPALLGRPIWQYTAQDGSFDLPMGHDA